jgi:hypothetical protein
VVCAMYLRENLKGIDTIICILISLHIVPYLKVTESRLVAMLNDDGVFCVYFCKILVVLL